MNKARLAEKIADLVKTQKIKDIADLNDESNREGMRLVIETKRGANPHVVLNQLYKHTQLQDNFGVIMLALVDGVPRTLNLAEMVGYYVDHQVDVVTRRTRFELRKAEERDHIVLGLLIALDHLDEVIKIIRASQDADAARKKLMSTFELSEIQANHILDMPLRRLTKLAREELDKEHAELLERIGYLTSLLDDPVKLRGVIKDELAEIRKKHADGRRTTVKADDGRPRRRGPDRRGGRDHLGQPRRLREAAAGRRVQAAGSRRQGRAGPEPQGRGRRQARVHHDHAPLDAVLHHEGPCLPREGARDPGVRPHRPGHVRRQPAGRVARRRREDQRGHRPEGVLGRSLPAVRHAQGHREEDRAAGVRLAAHRPHRHQPAR